jgi:hypothetical protein
VLLSVLVLLEVVVNGIGQTTKMMKNWTEKSIGIIVISILSICIIVIASCGVSKSTQTKTHNCELMQQGQKCLSDHSCCK